MNKYISKAEDNMEAANGVYHKDIGMSMIVTSVVYALLAITVAIYDLVEVMKHKK